MTENGHQPVLPAEVIEFLDPVRAGVYVDCTLGLAGHALAVLKKNPRARLIGIDRDGSSLEAARERLKPFARRVTLYQADFKDLGALDIPFAEVRGFLADLGISSFQLDAPERGFSYMHEGPLDMRVDRRTRTTAGKILHDYPEQKLAEMFARYGELDQTRRLAREIAHVRKLGRLETTGDLRVLIERLYRWRPQKGRIHPAAKAFQALRIEVNGELAGLGEFLADTVRRSVPGTRFVVISFHSLEDRIVKRAFQALAAPDEGGPLAAILTRKPVMASEAEVAANPRARSAKLRAAERI
ncbi:MAG TPA: 16S rRNA (cytosine(1402)-N(4))-methyltransferase RsmH [Candidatus Aminicenantes bacterium]|nr:16S rRNA (cytosine(1402)-N(4))-methyltransferase RsmH [Candidatus Aminicenantes bacterium]HRY65082.1 16S rRNA (cytosine(1402)-N(4))-methyltransferase RsmH [Candidatus Aminicenantes bacterium]HRZ71995.1 16S rRNA (cytosine(1402)-N(4))-methyltransferase RsmH [Candidatus Aminicenantes bacterium]